MDKKTPSSLGGRGASYPVEKDAVVPYPVHVLHEDVQPGSPRVVVPGIQAHSHARQVHRMLHRLRRQEERER